MLFFEIYIFFVFLYYFFGMPSWSCSTRRKDLVFELRIWIGKRMACIVLISLSLCLIIRLVEFKHNINILYEQSDGYKT